MNPNLALALTGGADSGSSEPGADMRLSVLGSGIVRRVRLSVSVVLALTISGAAHAERLIVIPIGDRYATGQVHFEALFEGYSFADRNVYVGFGFGKAFDAEVVLTNNRGMSRDVATFDLAYNFLPAVPDFGVGISVGVQDLLNQHPSGRGAYVAITSRVNNYQEINANTPLELTLGAGSGRFKGVFMGAKVPLSDKIRLLAEHDSVNVTAGLEIVPFKDLGLRWVVGDRQTRLGVTFLARF